MNMKDRMVYAKYWLIIWAKILVLVLKHGPYDMVRDMIRYPWLIKMLKVTGLMTRLVRGRSGQHREAVCMIMAGIVTGLIELLEGIFFHADEMILSEDMIPPELFRAMGLRPWNAELLGMLLPMLEPGGVEQYIDVSENEGMPPDICSLPKSTMGITLKGEMPLVRAAIASNLPCDGGMASYNVIEREMKVPMYRLDIPYNFYNKRAEDYFVGEIRDMIAWLEKQTSRTMDWNRLREICAERNRMAELELELWETVRVRPAPMSAESIYLSHMWNFNIFPGSSQSTHIFKRLLDMAHANLAEGRSAVPGERYRAALWNPPLIHFIDLFNWAERAYGVSLLMDSMSYNRQALIDTATDDSMLRGLANIIMQGPMARHTRGPAENYLEDIFHIYRHFNLDMIWVAGHIGCKNTVALNGILREKCRAAGIPLLIIEYDLTDPRIVPRDAIINQVEHFMENVMKAKRSEV